MSVLDRLRPGEASPDRRRPVTVALVGSPGSGKTSLLSAIVGHPRMSDGWKGVEWKVSIDDSMTREFLVDNWTQLKEGQSIPKTTHEDAASRNLRLRLQREMRGSVTHVLELHGVDTPGEIIADATGRRELVELIGRKVREASVVVWAIDGTNLLPNGASELGPQFLAFLDREFPGPQGAELNRKSLAVCVTKCDVVADPKIDNVNDEADAESIVRTILKEFYSDVCARFGQSKCFAVSVLGDHWRWRRHQPPPGRHEPPFDWSKGAFCSRVRAPDGSPLRPLHHLAPFEWMAATLKLGEV
jgi:GTPase SAR1 family protein